MHNDGLPSDRSIAVERLKLRGLTITEAELVEGEEIAAARGLRDSDGHFCVFIFLERLSPYGVWKHTSGELPEPWVFPGWEKIRAGLRLQVLGLSDQEKYSLLHQRYGSDALRMAAILSHIDEEVGAN